MKKNFIRKGGNASIEIDTSVEACSMFSARPRDALIYNGRIIILVGAGRIAAYPRYLHAFFRYKGESDVFTPGHLWCAPGEITDLQSLGLESAPIPSRAIFD
ncbi:MAG: hypothetical protein PF542_05485 [Nanoarchaeota archaeon]|jgi:hypothetical protein|nr:hypothetical protein [Nanoarchaeota archaeon]